jgi:single-strand DNA-binding protein
MASFNQVMLIGNLGQDPETKAMPDGSRLCNMSIATSEHWKDKTTGDKRERTQWHRIVVWDGRMIENLIEPYLHKGDSIMVIGQLETRKWQDQSGADRFMTEVVLRPFTSKLQIMRSKSRHDGNGADAGPAGDDMPDTTAARKPAAAAGAKLDDEIPF